MKLAVVLLAVSIAPACTVGEDCRDEADQLVTCEPLDDVPELALPPDVEDPAGIGGVDTPADLVPGPDDLDGVADEAVSRSLADDGDTAAFALPIAMARPGSTALDFGRTKNAELRRFLPIGRTAGTRRYVVMRLAPHALPGFQDGDRLRAAAELQVTTRCDIGQVAPGCDYSPHVAVQLVLSADPQGTDPHAANTIALSQVKSFECSKDDHHCVKTFDFGDASLVLHHQLGCLADNSCYVNLVAWAHDDHARSNGQDVLILGANEGNFLANHDLEQDRGRIMAIRERDIAAGDVSLRVTGHDVKSGAITFGSNGDEHRIYSATLNGGRDLRAGEKYLVWAEIDAAADHRADFSVELYLTKNRTDRNGGSIDGTSPQAISEHNGGNLSPGNDLHLRKVAAFAVDRDIAGPVYVNIAASSEVPGPGYANITVHDTGFIKVLKYAR